MWLDVSIYDARTISVSTRDMLVNKCRLLNNSLSKYIDWKCVNETTDLFVTGKHMSSYFYPVYIEFLLLCIEILIKLFFTMKSDDVIQSLKETGRRTGGQENVNRDCANEVFAQNNSPLMMQDDNLETRNYDPGMHHDLKHRHDNPQDPDTRSEDIRNAQRELTNNPDSATATGNEGVTVVSSRPRVRHADFDENLSPESISELEQGNDDPSAPLLGPGQDGSVSYGTTRGSQPGNGNDIQVGGMSEAIVRLGRASNAREKSFTVWCLIAIIMNASLIVFGALTYLHKSHDMWNDIYQIAKIIYWIPLLGAIGIAYSALPDMASAFFEYSGLELMVVFSIFGFALNAFFSLIAAVSVIGGSMPIAHSTYMTTNSSNTTVPWYDIFEYPETYIPPLVIADKMLNIMQVFFPVKLAVARSPSEATDRGGIFA